MGFLCIITYRYMWIYNYLEIKSLIKKQKRPVKNKANCANVEKPDLGGKPDIK